MLESFESTYAELKDAPKLKEVIESPGVQMTVGDIDEALRRITYSFSKQKDDDFLHRVLVNFLEMSWSELGEIITELDK